MSDGMPCIARPRPYLACCLVLMLWLAGCVPDQRDNSPPAADVPSDTKAKPDISAKPDTAADVASAATPDAVEQVDSAAIDQTSLDVDEADATLLPQGCATDTDCQDLAVPACQKISCNAATGLCELSNTADGAACVADACTVDATCASGACLGKTKSCDDKKVCTSDACHPLLGCVYSAAVVPCDDANACTNNDACKDGTCGGAPIDCVDADPCTLDGCNPNGGCTHLPTPATATVACVVDKPCGGAGTCKGNVCVGSGGSACDDGNPCTQDGCKGVGWGPEGCLHLQMVGATCTVSCDPGVCTVGAGKIGCFVAKSGKSTNPCIVAKPCAANASQWTYDNLPDGTPCKVENNPCLTGNTCAKGLCDSKSGTKLVCDDGNPCTADGTCTTGCTFTPVANPCNDGNACTASDACSNGACSGTAIKCDDGNPCTTDSCVPFSGCAHAIAADGTSCGADKTCQKAACTVKP